MRARNIKPGFFTNEILGTADPMVCLLFAGLWCIADKDGRLEDRPLRIKAELFPYRESLDVNGYLTVLERSGFITRYEVGGIGYIQVENFAKHQSPHHTEKPKGYPSKIQQSSGHQREQSLTPLSNGEYQVSERSDSLIPDSLIPDSLIPDSLIPDSAPAPAEPDNQSAKARKVTLTVWLDNLPESEDIIRPDDPIYQWAEQVGLADDMIGLAWSAFEAKYSQAAKKYIDWRAVFRTAVRENWLKLWYIRDGQHMLTTVGEQSRRAQG